MDDLLNQMPKFELSPLDYFFLLVSVCSFLLILLRWIRVKELKNDSAINHIVNFLLGMALCFGVVGLLGLHAGSIYEAIDGKTFLGKNESLGDEGFIGLLAFVIGVPVALAGSVYAVLLSYQSIRLSDRSIDYAKKERRDRQLEEWDADVNQITKNFIRLSYSLQQMNVLATSHTDKIYNKLSDLGSIQDELDYKEALKSIDKIDSTNDLQESFFQVLNAVRIIQAHQSSCQLLENMIAIRSEPMDTTIASQVEVTINHPKQLVASQILEKDKDNTIFNNPAHRKWLKYASPEATEVGRVDALMDCLSILHVQSHRITATDMLRHTLFAITNNAVNAMRQGNEFNVPENGDFKKLFYFDWCSLTTRQREPDYFISTWLQMMFDMPVILNKKGIYGPKAGSLPLADIVVADLHHLVPSRSEVQKFLKRRAGLDSKYSNERDTKDQCNEQDFKFSDFVEEISSDTLNIRIENIEYPSKAPICSLSMDWLTIKDCKDTPLEKCQIFRDNNDNDSNKLLKSLKQNSDAFIKQWFETVKSHANRVFEEHLWECKSLADGGIKMAIASIESSRKLALSSSESGDFAILWWLMKARFLILQKNHSSAEDLNKIDIEIKDAYINALKLQSEMGNSTAESRIALLIEVSFFDTSINIENEVSKLDKDLDWVEILRIWYEGYVWLIKCVTIDEVPLTARELSEKSGIFPLILWHLRSKIDSELVFRVDEDSLSGVVTHPIYAKKLPFAPNDIRDVINSFNNELELENIAANYLPFVKYDDLYNSWRTALACKRVLLLPPYSK